MLWQRALQERVRIPQTTGDWAAATKRQRRFVLMKGVAHGARSLVMRALGGRRKLCAKAGSHRELAHKAPSQTVPICAWPRLLDHRDPGTHKGSAWPSVLESLEAGLACHFFPALAALMMCLDTTEPTLSCSQSRKAVTSWQGLQ